MFLRGAEPEAEHVQKSACGMCVCVCDANWIYFRRRRVYDFYAYVDNLERVCIKWTLIDYQAFYTFAIEPRIREI